MQKYVLIMSVIGGLVFSTGNVLGANDASHRLGAGLHYWGALEDVKAEEVDKSGISFVISYQQQLLELFRLETDLEFFGQGYAGAAQTVISPQVYVLAGRAIYGGGGLGINYSGGDFAQTPFFALRAGVDLEIFPAVYLDVHANYRIEKWDFERLPDEIDTNVITAGAIVRLAF